MNLSVILPFFKKADLFRMTLPLNRWYAQDDVEVICVLDEPTDELLVMQIVRNNPGIHFKVIVNDWPHAWRPPCCAYNVGVRHASSAHVILTDAESVVVLPHPRFLQELVAQDFRLCYAGLAWMETEFRPEDPAEVLWHKIAVCEATRPTWYWGYGFFMCPKIAFERIYGFDESRTCYGNDDNDVRVRLLRLGYKTLIDGRIKIFHSYHDNEPGRPSVASEPTTANIVLMEQKESWGRAYNRLLHSWESQ